MKLDSTIKSLLLPFVLIGSITLAFAGEQTEVVKLPSYGDPDLSIAIHDASQYWLKNGDSVFLHSTEMGNCGAFWEIKGFRIEHEKCQISEADKLNGIEWIYKINIYGKVIRKNSILFNKPSAEWTQWEDYDSSAGPLYQVQVVAKKSNLITTTKGWGGFQRGIENNDVLAIPRIEIIPKNSSN
ncbi:MAG: hypothetical protein M0Q93_12505 [Terrimicrobiaceae bacterium]|nr:hypothetical protein [Terrimicrobiaceae bacterium]